MNDLLLIGAALLLLAAGGANRKAIARKLGLPEDFGLSFFGAGNDDQGGAGAAFSPEPPRTDSGHLLSGNVFEPFQLPSNRKLTIEETFKLAQYYAFDVFGGQLEPSIITAMAIQESQLKPWATRNESRGRKSVGLMQTLIGTAQDMYNRGYTAVGQPSEQSLMKPHVSMYFGMAYMDWLQRTYPARHDYDGPHNNYWEWYVRAYNGGPGWKNSKKGREMTAVHWSKVKANLPLIDATLQGGLV